MISVLLPTRGRPEALSRSLDSLHDLASNPDRVEIIMRFDADDGKFPSWIGNRRGCRTIIGERWGYKRMHDYYNQLAAVASGSFLFMWNDDTDMLTKGWDEALVSSNALFQFLRRDIMTSADSTVPVIARRAFDAMGHISLNAHCDEWIRYICEDVAGAGVLRNDIVFHHHRLDDLTARERDQNYDVPGLHTPENKAARKRDADLIRALL